MTAHSIFHMFDLLRSICCIQLESFKYFDFDEWKQRYINWIREKKFRVTDFFRRQDRNGEGTLDRQQFVEGMMTSSSYRLFTILT